MREIVFGWIAIIFAIGGGMLFAVELGFWPIASLAVMAAIGGYAAGRGFTKRRSFRDAYALGYQQGTTDTRAWTPPAPDSNPPSTAPLPPTGSLPPQRYGTTEIKAAPSPRDW